MTAEDEVSSQQAKPKVIPAPAPCNAVCTRWLLSVLGVATVVSAIVASLPWLGILDFQLAGSGRRAVEVLRNYGSLEGPRLALGLDLIFIASYALLAFTALVILPKRTVRSETALRLAAWIAVPVAVLADLAEDGLSRRLIDRVDDSRLAPKVLKEAPLADVGAAAKDVARSTTKLGDQVDGIAHQMLACSLVKWVALFVLLAWGASLLRRPLQRPHSIGAGGPEVRFPPPRTKARTCAPGDDPDRWQPIAGRTGISCSGGGVRSASFCLGALQALDEAGELGKAEYVTAASGGAYLAAGMALAERTGTWSGTDGFPAEHPDAPVGPGDPLPFAAGSPEESWFRRNSAYLASNGGEVTAGVTRMLLGLAFNLFLIWLIIFAAARPLGWVMSSAAVHPELRAREPSVHVVAQPQAVGRDDEAHEVRDVHDLGNGVLEFRVVVVPEKLAKVEVWRPTLGTSNEKEIRPVVLLAEDGVGMVKDGVVSILRQPRLSVSPSSQIAGAINADPLEPTLQIVRQPRVVAEGGVAQQPVVGQAERIANAIRVEDLPRIRQLSGTLGRPSLKFDWRDKGLGLLPLGVATLLYLAKILARSAKGSVNRTLDFLAASLAVIGFVLALLFLILPWSVQHVPPWLGRLGGRLPGVATPSAGADRNAGSLLTVVLGAVGLSASSIILMVAKQFKRRPLLVVKVGSVVVLLGLAYVTLTCSVQMAAANGPTGRLTGIGLGSAVRWCPDYLKWGSVLLLLVGLAMVADAHSWSIFPYYKRRLSRAFFLHRRETGKAEPLPYEVMTSFWAPGGPAPASAAAAAPDRTVHIRPGQVPGQAGPQLVVCASANTVDEGVAAAGRRAVSFTFSSTEIGGPEVGYMPTKDYLGRLHYRRQRDVTVSSSVAISGAAASPAMGKASLGPIGRLLAVLNVRLGVWLPNPCWVNAMGGQGEWTGRPGWPYFLRELLGQFRIDHRYVYVTDGGHWENLGLVELMRRGCTRIFCISAAGDGPSSFGTIGEALALAREELGVEVQVELEPLRPQDPPAPPPPTCKPFPCCGSDPDPGSDPVPEPEPVVNRRLVREGEPNPMAGQSWVFGTYTYPSDSGEPVEGEIWVLEANLTQGMPWDVHAHAERWKLFPDDPTGDQLFNHRKFESYRRLGQFQVEKMLAESTTLGAAGPTPGSAG